MALFQRAPATQAEADKWKPLDIPPGEVLDMDEDEWYEKIYRGEQAPQLTLRAVLMGSVLGFGLAFTNLYVGLKTGWALGVAITAAIIAYTFWSIFLKIGLARTPMTILETNCMQSTASSAGYATGGTMVSAIAALLMIEGHHLPIWVLLAWTLFLGALGTVMAIPMKRNMINQERLKFPTGTAAAVTLQSLYSEGKEAVRKAIAMFVAAGIGAIFPLIIDMNVYSKAFAETRAGALQHVRSLFPSVSKIFDWLPTIGSNKDGKALLPSNWLMVFDNNPVMIAAGALVGLRITIYMTLSALALIYWLGPTALNDLWQRPDGVWVAATDGPGSAWKTIGIWSGVPIMVSSGLLAFAMQWKTIVRAVSSFGSNLHPREAALEEQVRRTEVPNSWFLWGTLISGACVVTLCKISFGIPILYGVIAVALTFFLALVACRATGESDITPVGAMGKIMQLTFGVLMPQSVSANLMTASVTASSAGSSADLLTDLKSGYLLGANPRRQFMAQFLGIFSGTLATVIGFRILVPDAQALLGVGDAAPKFPAPAAQAWKAVADLFKNGLQNMHPMDIQAIWWGLAAGVVFQLLETFLPKYRKWLPSATGIGLGLILPFQYPLSMLIGAIAAAVWTKTSAKSSEKYLVPVAAGLIAGVSIVGVIVAILNVSLLK